MGPEKQKQKNSHNYFKIEWPHEMSTIHIHDISLTQSAKDYPNRANGARTNRIDKAIEIARKVQSFKP